MTPIESMISDVLVPIDDPTISDDMPYATHSGVLNIMGVELKVYRLNTGQAIIDSEDMMRLFDGWMA